MHICWLVICRLPRKYKNPMQCCGKPCTRIEVEKPFCTTLSWFLIILYTVQELCTEQFGNMTNQQLFFPVNGPFVRSCQGLICLNLMHLPVFGSLKFKIIDFVHLILGTGHQNLLLQRKFFCKLHQNLLMQWKKNCTLHLISLLHYILAVKNFQ